VKGAKRGLARKRKTEREKGGGKEGERERDSKIIASDSDRGLGGNPRDVSLRGDRESAARAAFDLISSVFSLERD